MINQPFDWIRWSRKVFLKAFVPFSNNSHSHNLHESLTLWHWYVVFNCELDRKTNNWKCLLKNRIQRTQRTYRRRHRHTQSTLAIHYQALCATIHYPTNWMENVNLVDELLYAVARLLVELMRCIERLFIALCISLSIHRPVGAQGGDNSKR